MQIIAFVQETCMTAEPAEALAKAAFIRAFKKETVITGSDHFLEPPKGHRPR